MAALNSELKYPIYPLRPHHALCIRFFEGKGYSAEFTAHMQRVTDTLGKENAAVRLTLGGDVICSACPNLPDGSCKGRARQAKSTVCVWLSWGLKRVKLWSLRNSQTLRLKK